MRAEVDTADSSPRSIARYAVCNVGVEAARTAAAAVLPCDASGHVTGWLLAMVWVLYPGSLLPTVLSARLARAGREHVSAAVPSADTSARQVRAGLRVSARWPITRVMAADGGGIMVISAGPTLLAIPLTEQVHGNSWVAGAAIAACLRTLLSSRAIGVIERVPVVPRWPMWGQLLEQHGTTITPTPNPSNTLINQLATNTKNPQSS
jgi:hypothetical protein